MRRCKGGKAMNLEELDGFFAALVAGPETGLPSEYYPQVFGGSMEETCEFDSLDQVNATLGLLSRHWNTIAGTLYADEVYMPLLLEDDKGVAACQRLGAGVHAWRRTAPGGMGHRDR